MGKIKNITNQKFNRLKVLRYEGKGKSHKALWLCKCDCGNFLITAGIYLRNGDSKSCGCLNKEMVKKHSTTHGMSHTTIYKIWKGMVKRCNDPNFVEWEYYGGRGIRVCDRWRKFENFYKDMGDRPKGLTIERIDNNKGYSPNNCKWATPKENCRNKRNNRLVTFKGQTKPAIVWAEQLGINYKMFWARLKRGWSIERALIQPIQKHVPRSISGVCSNLKVQ